MTKMESDWVKLATAARLAGVGRTSMHDAAARGEIPFAWTDHGRLFKVEDIERWKEEREMATKTKAVP
jgi:hypothetical protein